MKKDANSYPEIAPPSWLRLRAVWLLGFIALLLLGLASWGAWFQKPHINAYRLPASVLSKDFWAYPVEQNAFRRLPEINSNLKDVFVLPDGKQLWAVGDGGLIVHSADGGFTWQKQTVVTGEQLNQVHISSFNPLGHAWAGELPSQQQQNSVKQNYQNISQTPAQIPAQVLEKATQSAEQKLPEVTPPAIDQLALPATPQKPKEFNTILNAVFFSDTSHGWAVGGDGVILATNDGGQHWQPQLSGVTSWLNGVQFNDPSHGWAVGGGGVILSTNDGGQHWQPQTSGVNSVLVGLQFRGISNGWVVGGEGVILSTDDGGQHWQSNSHVVKSSINGVQFSDASHGWVVGNDGVILSSRNGGQYWQPQTSGVYSTLWSVHFSDVDKGWAVGENGIILTTSDGGQLWQPQSSGLNSALIGVQFSDASHGWVVGDQGVILVTNNGGKSWFPQSRPSNPSIEETNLDYRRYPPPWIYPILLIAIFLVASTFWQLAGQTNGEKPKKGIIDRALTDKPAGPNSKDLLGARKIAAGLTRFLTNKNTQPPITIAITGEWGSGKSSVMNYMFTGLKRQGLTPVWFNAWHHREEQNVLGSILTNIHKQAIGPWWSLHGAWFRLRLQWQRNCWMKLLLLTLAFTLTFSICWLLSHDKERDQVFHYALYRMGIEQPVMISRNSYEAVCPDQGRLNLPIQAPDKSPEGNLPISRTALFSQENCVQLKALVSEANDHKDMLLCNSDLASRCFADPDQFLDSVEKQLGLLLTVENEALLLKTIEHLHPDFPVQLSPTVIKWLSALFAVLTLFAFKGMALIGLAPAKVVQGVLSVAGTTPAANEPVGTRVLFEKHFQRITQVLGKRRLVLFIDDLDRCDREHTRQVLEITNFLASAGELFIVLGMAPRYVLANVTLCFQDVAKAVHEADVLNGDGENSAHSQDAGQSWFARHYLQKLIHIEVPVPKPETAQVLAFLKGESDQANRDIEEVKIEKLEQAEKRLGDIGTFLGTTIAWLFLLTAIIVGGLLGSGQLDFTLPEQTSQQSNTEAGVKSHSPETQTPTRLTPDRQNREDNKGSGELFKAGVIDSNHPFWQLLPFFALLLVMLALFWLSRQPKLLETKGLSWLQPLFHRLKLSLLGPVSGNDSASFADALEIWHELIALTNPTPRNIKAFLNQLRYFASREFTTATEGDHHEAQLVALASMYYAFGDEMMKTFEFQHSDEKWRLVNINFKTKIAEKGILAALETALAEHFEKFGAFPNEQDQKLYQALCEDISIQRHD